MAHEITIRGDGTAEAAFAMQPAWHGLGKVYDRPMTSAEALKAAKLDWQVVQVPVAYLWPPKPEEVPKHYVRVTGFFANCRSDTGEVLGVVKERYRIVQNVEGFRFLDGLVESRQMLYESAFSLCGGKRVVLLARLPQVDTIAKGDELKRYILLGLDHSGEGAIRFGPTAVRVVCANTYKLALGKGGILSIRHQGSVLEKLQEAALLLGRIDHEFSKYAEVCRQLARYRLKAIEWQSFLDTVFPWPKPDSDDKQKRSVERVRDAVSELRNHPRQMGPGIEHTAWAAFCAVTEYVDHEAKRGQHGEARFKRCLEGYGHELKQKAFKAACQIAGIGSAA